MSRWFINSRGQKRKIDDPRCGTAAGHTRHVKAGEKPCDACAAAKRAYDADWRAQPENVLRNRLAAKAQMAAYKALSHKYKAEYDALYTEGKARLFAEHGLEQRSKGVQR